MGDDSNRFNPGAEMLAEPSAPDTDDRAPANAADHAVKFYGDDATLAVAVSKFLAEGLLAGDSAIVVATAAHRVMLEARLEADGILRPDGVAPPVLFVDARETLSSFMRADVPDRALFNMTVGGLVADHALKSRTGRVRVFGEMVDVLWASGQRGAALQLEDLWNELQRLQSFTLLCAYAVDRFFKEPAALRAVCDAHRRVSSDGRGNGQTETGAPPDAGPSTQLVEEIAHRKEVERALRESLVLLRRREEVVRRSEAHTGRLLRVTAAIADAVTPDQVYQATVDHVATALDAATAALWLVDRSTLRLVRAVGYSDAARRQYDGADLDSSRNFPALDAVRRNTPIWIASQHDLVQQYPELAARVTPGRAVRVTCLPIVSQGRAVGALGLTIGAEGQPSDGEREFLLLVARYASQAIERLRLLEAERTIRARAEELYRFAQAVMAASRVEQVFDAAMNAIHSSLGADRSAILLNDDHGVMRFRAWRNLPESYRRAVDGHSPWARDAVDPQPVLVVDAQADEVFSGYRDLFAREGIGALAFVPLVNAGRLLGKFMVYYDRPHTFVKSELETAEAIANHLASVTARFAATAKLEETVHYNELFAGVLAHDLRSPLSAILVAAQVGLISNEEDREAHAAPVRPFGRILTSGQRMSRMIDQLLDLTIARSGGRIPLHTRLANLKDLCADAVSELELAHPDWRFTCDTLGDPSGTWDPDRLLQVASNVLANAGHHGKTGTAIAVRIDGTAPDAVLLEVRNGGTVPRDILTSVFDPFQAVRRRGDRSRGLGLGLFIVRELVAAHGGSAEIESSEELDQTTVTIRLPRRGPDETARPVASA